MTEVKGIPASSIMKGSEVKVFKRIPNGLVRDILIFFSRFWFKKRKPLLYPYLGKYLKPYEKVLESLVKDSGLTEDWQQERLSEFNLRSTLVLVFFGILELSLSMLILVLVWYLPYILLRLAFKQRQETMIKELPQLVDYLVLCGGGGLNLYQSLKFVTEVRQGIFYAELKEVVAGVEVGIPLTKGLINLRSRLGFPVLESFLGALIYGETLGIPLKETLQSEAELQRTLRRQGIEKSLNAVPFKMTIISMVFLFPVVVILVLLPHMVGFMNSNW